MLERQAAADAVLPIKSVARASLCCVAISRERRQRGGVGRLVGKVGGHDGDEVALVDGVEDLEGARDFEPALFRRAAPADCAT